MIKGTTSIEFLLLGAFYFILVFLSLLIGTKYLSYTLNLSEIFYCARANLYENHTGTCAPSKHKEFLSFLSFHSFKTKDTHCIHTKLNTDKSLKKFFNSTLCLNLKKGQLL